MNVKEGFGILTGIILAVVIPVLSLGILSKDNQKGRNEPVMQLAWEQAEFRDQTVETTLKDLDIKKIQGFLFRENSQTPVYYAVYVGKSQKGKDAVKAYFKDSKQYPAGYYKREEATMKILGDANPAIFSGKKVKNEIEICYSGDYVIISYASQATNTILDELQMEHFLHRYFQKKKK